MSGRYFQAFVYFLIFIFTFFLLFPHQFPDSTSGGHTYIASCFLTSFKSNEARDRRHIIVLGKFILLLQSPVLELLNLFYLIG